MRPHLCEPCALHRNGFWLSVSIAKVIEIFNRRVILTQRLAFEGLEPYDGNLSRTVLRGLGASNGPRLPGICHPLHFLSNYPIN